MRRLEPDLAVAGARLVFVGTGTPAQAAAFAAAHSGQQSVFVDPDRAAFAAAGMRRSFLGVLSPRLLRNAWRAWRAGHRQGAVQGDAWQLGGVVVLAPDGAVVHRQVERVAGDPVDLAGVGAAVGSAGA